MRRKHSTVLRLRRLRQEREISQTEVARRVGLHINGYARIEMGQADPKLSTAVKIARIFRKPVEEVFEQVEVVA